MSIGKFKIPDKWVAWIGQGGLVLGLSYIFTFIIDLRQEDRIDYQFMLQSQQRTIEKLESRVSYLESVERDKDKIISILQATQQGSPFPIWAKDLKGRMVSLNDAYEDAFISPNGLRKEQYIGKTDSQFWALIGQQDHGIRYHKNDHEIMESEKMTRFEEKIYINGVLKDLTIYKYPIYDPSDFSKSILIGIGGIAIFK